MAAGQHDFECEQGATFAKTLTWTTDNDDPMELTGAVVRMHVRPTIGSSVTVMELSTTNGRISVDPVEAKISLSISAEDTADLDGGPTRKGKTYRYDIEVAYPDDRVTRLLEGDFIVTPEVTR